MHSMSMTMAADAPIPMSVAAGQAAISVEPPAATEPAASTPGPPALPAPPPPCSPAPINSSHSISFDAVFAELQAWHRQHDGRVTIPASHPAMARITDALTALGIEALARRRWDDQFAQLRAHRARHGQIDVPPAAAPALGAWVRAQRDYCRRRDRGLPSPLPSDRFDRLRGLGLTANRWEQRLGELRAYREDHGHCDVPLDYPKLGVWVLNQRDTYHFERAAMSQDRIEALETLGFNWNRWGRNRLKVREDAWEVQFNQLTEFIKKNGECQDW